MDYVPTFEAKTGRKAVSRRADVFMLDMGFKVPGHIVYLALELLACIVHALAVPCPALLLFLKHSLVVGPNALHVSRLACLPSYALNLMLLEIQLQSAGRKVLQIIDAGRADLRQDRPRPPDATRPVPFEFMLSIAPRIFEPGATTLHQTRENSAR